MIICIEGCDGSGKSTLVELLPKVLGGLWHRMDKLNGFPTIDDLSTFQKVLTQMPEGFNLILDRHRAISEHVYAGVSSLRPAPDPVPYLDGVDLYIWCRPPTEVIMHNCRMTRQHDWVTRENLPQLIEAYDKIMIRIGDDYPVITFDYTKMTPVDLIKVIYP